MRRFRSPSAITLLAVLAVIAGAALSVTTVLAVTSYTRTNRILAEQREGREVAIRAFCEIDLVIIEQGKKALQGTPLPPRASAALERLGLGSAEQRAERSAAAAVEYELEIGNAIRRAAGQPPTTKPEPLDCDELVRASNAAP